MPVQSHSAHSGGRSDLTDAAVGIGGKTLCRSVQDRLDVPAGIGALGSVTISDLIDRHDRCGLARHFNTPLTRTPLLKILPLVLSNRVVHVTLLSHTVLSKLRNS